MEGSASRWRASLTGSSAKRPSATALPSTTAITPSTVRSRPDGRPIKSLDQGLGQSKARGLDNDVVRERIKRENVVRSRARKSSATVQQMQPLASSMMLSAPQARSPQPFNISAVDADIAKFVDDKGEAAALGIFQEVANEGRLPSAKKAGDNRCRDFGKTDSWASTPFFGAVGGSLNRRSRANPELLAGGGKAHRHR